MGKKISVIMATYQGEAYIRQQLDSIFSQTKQPDEIIIFDDASQDRTIEIIAGYQKQHSILHIYQQESRVGYIKNFASALAKCSGDMIFFCDQDDIWECEKIEKLYDILQKHPEILCVNTAFQYIDADGNPIKTDDLGNNHGYLWNSYPPHALVMLSLDEILIHNISMGCTMAIKKEIRDLYLHYSTHTCAHDWECNLCAALKNGLAFYNEPLIRYRIHENNTIGNDKMNHHNTIYATSREKNADALLSFIHTAKRYLPEMKETYQKRVHQLDAFHSKRFTLLKEGKTRCWFSLLQDIKTYHQIVSYRGMIADVIYSFRK